MYLIKIDSYYVKTRRDMHNSVHSRERMGAVKDELTPRAEFATRYSLHFAQYLAEKYKSLKPVIVKG